MRLPLRAPRFLKGFTGVNLKFFVNSLCATSLILLSAATSSGQSIRHWRTTAAGVPIQVITVDLNNPNVKVTAQMPKFGAGHSEPFGQMVRRTQPTVALTGTFFCTQSKLPVGDIVIDGQLEHFGGLGTAMCITDNNEVEFVKTERYKHQDWSKYDFVISCGPRLLTDGNLTVYPKAEGFKDRHMLKPNSRLAVGVTKSKKLIFVTTRKPVVLSKMARAMKAIGVHNALNLDAGSSLGVHYKGKTLIKPGRWLTNLILVYNDKNRYYDRKEALAPGKQVASKASVPALPAPTSSGDASHLTLPMPAFPVQKPQQP